MNKQGISLLSVHQSDDCYQDNFDEEISKTKLPPIRNSQQAYLPVGAKSDIFIPETSVVIGTRKRSTTPPYSTNHQVEDWKSQYLFSANPEVQKTKLEWENDIARHILSLYATTNALKNLQESHSLLDFVGEKQKPANPSVEIPQEEIDDEMTITTKIPAFGSPAGVTEEDVSELKSYFRQSVVDISLKANEPGKSNASETTRAGIKKKKKKGMRGRENRTYETRDQDSSSTRFESHMTKEEQNYQNQRFINQIIDRMENTLNLSKEKDKYRVSNTIRTKEGKEIVVRGSPRCFPIWFVSSGDIYVDWTGLVGGRQLQSHLSVLYENHYYDEYVNILQTMLLTYWREKSYGKEEFKLESFGKSSSALNTSCSRNRSSSSKANPAALTSRPISSSSTVRGEKSAGKSSQVTSANNKFLRHSGNQSRSATVSDNPPHVSFYENVLNSEIDHSIRNEIEQKVNLFNSRRDREILPSSADGTIIPSELNQPPADLSLALLTIKDLEKFWKQLILTTIAIGIISIERKQYDNGMKFFIRADEFSQNDDLIPTPIERKEYRAHVKDAMSYYFFKREKFIAALAYSSQALEVFEMRGTNLEAIAICLLHIAATYSQMGKFKDSHKVLFQFLAMVENGRLALQDATPKQLCLVAVGYHNLAVVQLKLAMPDLACKSSQNARKIARLCLAYSNRWIDIFQYTHEVAINDMKYELQSLTVDQITPQQMLIVKELAEALFSIDSQA